MTISGAMSRYLLDPEFHARVYEAAELAEQQSGKRFTREERHAARKAAIEVLDLDTRVGAFSRAVLAASRAVAL